MTDLTDYSEVELIKHFFRTGSFPKPTVLGIALFTGAPGDAGGGVEVSGGNYARVNLPPLDTNWDATSGTDGKTANTVVITFPVPSANWGTVTHMAIFDATTGGNYLFARALTTPKTINNGDPAPTFPAGTLTITFD